MTILQGFRIENGQMRIGEFNTDLPEGWFDSPTKAERAVNPPVVTNPPKRPVLKLKRAK